MEVSAAKALNRILSDAKCAFDRVYNREVSGEEMELLKTSFSDSEIERHRTEFDAEFLSNFKEYNDEELLHEYLVMNLEEVKSISISQTNTEILRNDWEVNYLVRLKNSIIKQWNYIYSLLQVEVEYDVDEDEEYFGYPNMTDYLGDLSREADNMDGECRVTKKQNSVFGKDIRFQFDALLEECEMLTTLSERIKLITKRIYEFKQWKIQTIQSEKDSVFPILNSAEFYYPNFEQLCELEITKLEELIKLDASTQNTAQTRQVAEVQTTQKNTSDYVWKSSATDLLELVAALYQNKSIERRDRTPLTRKELIEYFQKLFDMEIIDIENKLTKAGNRNKNTVFLDKLSQQFREYVAGKEAKMVKRR